MATGVGMRGFAEFLVTGKQDNAETCDQLAVACLAGCHEVRRYWRAAGRLEWRVDAVARGMRSSGLVGNGAVNIFTEAQVGCG